MAEGMHCRGGGVVGEMATAADGTHPTGMHSCWRTKTNFGFGFQSQTGFPFPPSLHIMVYIYWTELRPIVLVPVQDNVTVLFSLSVNGCYQ